jgi:DNA-binding MarR family transcriptional regulator
MKTIEEELNTTFKSEHIKTIINLKFTSNWIANMQNNYISQFDLSMAQFNILRILRGAKDFININTVKDRMVEKSPNSTRLMDKLLEKQLIERKRCEIDRRVVYVKISELGLKLLAKIDESFDDNLLFANKLNNQETILLNQLLDKVRS